MIGELKQHHKEEVWSNIVSFPSDYTQVDKDKWSLKNLEVLGPRDDQYFKAYSKITDELGCDEIFFKSEDVINFFPGSEITHHSVFIQSGTLLQLNDAASEEYASKYKNLGRPAKFKWAEFYEHLNLLVLTSRPPKTQSILVLKMLKWCKKKWNIEPAESAIKEKVRIIYGQWVEHYQPKSKS